mmetsp:Transcript_32501/g.36861  ORF Transcript_32501/g.36861 Transcript_32501/m.36861 type:complete len:217 (-) Transcript_32501:280-930(-)
MILFSPSHRRGLNTHSSTILPFILLLLTILLIHPTVSIKKHTSPKSWQANITYQPSQQSNPKLSANHSLKMATVHTQRTKNDLTTTVDLELNPATSIPSSTAVVEKSTTLKKEAKSNEPQESGHLQMLMKKLTAMVAEVEEQSEDNRGFWIAFFVILTVVLCCASLQCLLAFSKKCRRTLNEYHSNIKSHREAVNKFYEASSPGHQRQSGHYKQAV